MLALLDKGDTCVVATPCYQSLHSIASSIGCKVVQWGVQFDPKRGQWYFDVKELDRLLRATKPKMLVANFPHNPTGALPSKEEFYAIAHSCEVVGCWFFLDEM
jgi:aspartate/methionine/tyrosine aminotransferase